MKPIRYEIQYLVSSHDLSCHSSSLRCIAGVNVFPRYLQRAFFHKLCALLQHVVVVFTHQTINPSLYNIARGLLFQTKPFFTCLCHRCIIGHNIIKRLYRSDQIRLNDTWTQIWSSRGGIYIVSTDRDVPLVWVCFSVIWYAYGSIILVQGTCMTPNYLSNGTRMGRHIISR